MEQLLALKGRVEIDYDWEREEKLELEAQTKRRSSLKSKGLLLDTCAWSNTLSHGLQASSKPLKTSPGRRSLCLCPVLYELSQGIRSEKEKLLLANAFTALVYLEMNETLWLKAGELSALVKKQGKTVPLSDILIASLALEHDLAILTMDKHFQQIPGLKLYPLKGK